MFRRSIPVVALAALLLVLSCAPAIAAPSLAFNFSGITNGGIDAGFDLSEHLTLATRAGMVFDPYGYCNFNAQLGLRYYINSQGPLFVFTSFFAGASYLVDLSGVTTYANPLNFIASVGGGLEYRADNGAFAFAGIETHWYGFEYLEGYWYAIGFGKRF